MAYRYHLFISYKRGDWTPWIRDIFRPEIERYLQPEIQEKLEIFVDERIEDGKSWPIELSISLACARLLLPVLSVEYFGSDWCRRELAHMLEREARLGFRKNGNAEGLIAPIWLFDGDKFPNLVQDIQAPRFHEFALRSIPRGRLENKFIRSVREHVQKIVRLLYNVVPEHDPAWLALDGKTVLPELTICVAHNAQQKLSNP
jgi:TIR domain-containing protein